VTDGVRGFVGVELPFAPVPMVRLTPVVHDGEISGSELGEHVLDRPRQYCAACAALGRGRGQTSPHDQGVRLVLHTDVGAGAHAARDATGSLERPALPEGLRHEPESQPRCSSAALEIRASDSLSGFDENPRGIRSPSDEFEQARHFDRRDVSAPPLLVSLNLFQDHGRETQTALEIERKVRFDESSGVARHVDIAERLEKGERDERWDPTFERRGVCHMEHKAIPRPRSEQAR
jgi:hypothetical protein